MHDTCPIGLPFHITIRIIITKTWHIIQRRKITIHIISIIIVEFRLYYMGFQFRHILLNSRKRRKPHKISFPLIINPFTPNINEPSMVHHLLSIRPF